MSWDWLLPALGPAAQIGGSLIGGILGSNATNKAAQQASAATLQGAQIQADALRQQQAALQGYREEMRPGDTYLQRAVAEPGTLTPAQQIQLQDLRRSTGNQIRTSSIAGSGRTAAALLNDVENRYTVNALDTNRNRAYNAATGMATRGGNALTRSAEVSGDIGRVMGQGTTQAGMYGAQAGLANANLQGRAIGEIGSAIANYNKPKSSYGNFGGLGGDYGSLAKSNTGYSLSDY